LGKGGGNKNAGDPAVHSILTEKGKRGKSEKKGKNCAATKRAEYVHRKRGY